MTWVAWLALIGWVIVLVQNGRTICEWIAGVVRAVK